MSNYDAITDGFRRDLSPLARRIYAAIFDATSVKGHNYYIAEWHLQELFEFNLGFSVCAAMPGTDAMKELIDAYLIYELPDLHHRYTLTSTAWKAHYLASQAEVEQQEAELNLLRANPRSLMPAGFAALKAQGYIRGEQ